MYNLANTDLNLITVCAQGHKLLFGDIVSGVMELSDAGKLVQEAWSRLPKKFSNIQLDQFIVMPNHVHGIIALTRSKRSVLSGLRRANDIRHLSPIEEIIRVFKVDAAEAIHKAVTHKFEWQRRYTLDVLESEEALIQARKDILENPADWDFDPENTAKRGRHVAQD